jgi:predicted nucleic acid-binding protein
VTLFVDTTVWSLALRRDAVPDVPEVQVLRHALESGTSIVTMGIVLQELLQGFSGPKASASITERFGSIPMLTPDRQDYIAAAALRNECRRAGVQAGTIDALIAQLCIRHELTLLTTDKDFMHMQRIMPKLQVWGQGK